MTNVVGGRYDREVVVGVDDVAGTESPDVFVFEEDDREVVDDADVVGTCCGKDVAGVSPAFDEVSFDVFEAEGVEVFVGSFEIVLGVGICV